MKNDLSTSQPMDTDVLIIGAGPFGLALAAQAAHDGINHLIVGKPMEFWRQNMPKGMYLRSDCDWHLDTQNVHTLKAYTQLLGKTARDVEPLSLEFYLSYCDWFQHEKELQPLPIYINRLDRNGSFRATTYDDNVIEARQVVLAPGFRHFANVPAELRQKLPEGRFEHTAEFVDFADAANKRYLIIGGRQSAFEWAALLLEGNAAAVHISHRHASPAFAIADWEWVIPVVDTIAKDPNWFRRLSEEEKAAVNHKLWSEGRLKIEPWLEPRLQSDRLHVWPHTELVSCEQQENSLCVTLSNEEKVLVDNIVLATGYKVNIARLPYLKAGNLLQELKTQNGFPVLDDHFETSVPGLFITSMPATQDFGPFFGFTVSVRASAKLICERLSQQRG
jgi:cation diffusion facilitator CzcD-associated flavoprotein CzcO